jgi:preprotein translocase subunit SecG
MNLLDSAVLAVHVLAAVAVCGFVLLQHGKGADMGAAFGGGSSGSLFGAAGSANFLSRSTAILATIFFLTSGALTYLGSQRGAPQGVMEKGVMEKGVMERVLPAKPSDVPAPKASDVPAPAPAAGANAVPAPSGAHTTNGGGNGGSNSPEVPK